jgi:hypothetical protein
VFPFPPPKAASAKTISWPALFNWSAIRCSRVGHHQRRRPPTTTNAPRGSIHRNASLYLSQTHSLTVTSKPVSPASCRYSSMVTASFSGPSSEAVDELIRGTRRTVRFTFIPRDSCLAFARAARVPVSVVAMICSCTGSACDVVVCSRSASGCRGMSTHSR